MNAVAQKQENAVSPQRVETEQEFVTPEVNIVETKEGYVLEAEMPGVTKDGLDIRMEDNVLSIVGRRGPVCRSRAEQLVASGTGRRVV